MKRAIPQIPPTFDPAQKRFVMALKENLEAVTGQRDDLIKALPLTADLTAVINKINEIIDQLQ